MKKFVVLAAIAGLFVSGSAFAAGFSTSFEGADPLAGWATNAAAGAWNAPVVETSIVYDGDQAIKLFNDNTGYERMWMSIPVDNYGTLTCAIYDHGYDAADGASFHGPTWGFDVGGMAVGPILANKSFLDSDAGYAQSMATNAVKGDLWSPGWLGGLADTRGDADAVPQAGWTTWEITITAADVTIAGEDASGNTLSFNSALAGAAPDSILFFAGRHNNPGIIVDAVTWTPVPEPASLGLLALGSLMIVRRR